MDVDNIIRGKGSYRKRIRRS